MVWQLFIQGLGGGTCTVNVDHANPQEVKVAELKVMIQNRMGIASERQRLIYAGKQLEDKCKLGDYPPLRSGSNIALVLQLPGGGNFWSTRRSRATRYEANNDRSSRVDPLVPRSNDECIITFDSDCVRMPCNHSISPDALMDYCWSEVSDNSRKYEIRCPLDNKEWTVGVIRRYGGATDEEMLMLEEGLSKNYCLQNPGIIDCPNCKSYCEREDKNNNCVQCINPACSQNNSRPYYFCWQCLHQWKNSPTAKTCGNLECNNQYAELLNRLHEAPEKSVIGINVPAERACPHCGSLVEHCDEGCKKVQCSQCNVQFCFICLRTRTNGSWPCGDSFTPCTPALRQERLPRRPEL